MEAMSASRVSPPLPGSHSIEPDEIRAAPRALQSRPDEPLLRFELRAQHIVVRYLIERDSRALEWQGGPDLRDWYNAQWQAHRDGHVCVLVADFNHFPVGQAAIHWRGKPTHPHIPDIQSLRVFPAFQGLGVGSRLLESCERAVAEHGFAQVSLAVGTENPRARSLYERVGYVAIGEAYRDEWHFVDARGQVQHMSENVIDLVKQL